MFHLGFAQKAPAFVLTENESTQLATRLSALLAHFNVTNVLPPWAPDAMFLAGTMGKIYLPRIWPASADLFGGETLEGESNG